MIVSVSEKKCTLKYISVGKNEIQYPVDAFHKRAKSTSWKIFIYILYTHTHANHYFFDYLTKMKWNKIKYKIKKKNHVISWFKTKTLKCITITHIYTSNETKWETDRKEKIYRAHLFFAVFIYIFRISMTENMNAIAICRWSPYKMAVCFYFWCFNT